MKKHTGSIGKDKNWSQEALIGFNDKNKNIEYAFAKIDHCHYVLFSKFTEPETIEIDVMSRPMSPLQINTKSTEIALKANVSASLISPTKVGKLEDRLPLKMQTSRFVAHSKEK